MAGFLFLNHTQCNHYDRILNKVIVTHQLAMGINPLTLSSGSDVHHSFFIATINKSRR